MNQVYVPDPAHDNDGTGTTKKVAQSVAGHAREAGTQVMAEGRHLAGQMGERLSGEAQSQNDRLASGLHKLADDLNRMGDGTDSVASTVMQQIGGASKQAATYLQTHGPQGLWSDVQEFARRRPGAFLLTAAAAGFLTARLGAALLPSSSNSSTADNRTRMTAVGTTPAGQPMPSPIGRPPMPSDSPVAARGRATS